MAGIWVDYGAVKAAVSMETVLANYGVRFYPLDGEYLRGLWERQHVSAAMRYVAGEQSVAMSVFESHEP
jgi:hypothetical protein